MPDPLPSVDLTRTIFQDLADLAREDPSLLDTLYASPHAVQCVFRALPPIARLYVSRLLYVPPAEAHVSFAAFRAALRRRQRAYDRHDLAVRALTALRVFVERPDGNLALHTAFAANCRQALTYAVQPVFGGPCDGSGEESTEAQQALLARLDAFAADKLEKVLNFLVESSGVNAPGGNVVRALVKTRILETRHDGMCITSAGFQFLLKDSFAQLWVLLRSILNTQFEGSRLEALDLLFKLSFACAGRLYRDPKMGSVQGDLLKELHELGVVMLEEGMAFRPTAIGVRLLKSANRGVGGAGAGEGGSSMVKTAGEIEIFVETNFRVYAYTGSSFQTNLLALFTHMRYRLPGMVVGHLTRDAVRRALMNGITGDQIIGYLNAHAHPRMRKGCIPPNVSDEIRLWEAEQERVQTRSGMLLGDFQTEEAFEGVVSYANDLGSMLWNNAERRQLVVAIESFDSVKAFVKTHRIQ